MAATGLWRDGGKRAENSRCAGTAGLEPRALQTASRHVPFPPVTPARPHFVDRKLRPTPTVTQAGWGQLALILDFWTVVPLGAAPNVNPQVKSWRRDLNPGLNAAS